MPDLVRSEEALLRYTTTPLIIVALCALAACSRVTDTTTAPATPPTRAPLPAKEAEALRNKADLYLAPVADGRQVVGVSAALYYKGHTLFFNYGSKVAGAKQLPDADTTYEIGSITKVFTAALLARLVVARRVALTDAVTKYVPWVKALPGETITLQMLSTHTSGLPRVPANMNLKSLNPYKDITMAKLQAFFAGYTPLKKSGTYEYSNLGAGLLGQVLAGVVGQPYGKALEKYVLSPLGMKNTSVQLTGTMRANMVTPYFISRKGPDRVPMWEFHALAGAGALKSSPRELSLFMGAVINPPATPLGEALRLMKTPRAQVRPGLLSMGLGWHIIHKKGRLILMHDGGTYGCRSMMLIDPTHRVGVVVLANGFALPSPVDKAAFKLFASLLRSLK